jgi:ppGpp synthetase/RelA/SpoT-type nucleotidyltranferase
VPPTKGDYNRAGDTMRDWWMNPNARNPRDMDVDDPFLAAGRLVLGWRASYQRPLKTATQGVRQFVRSVRGLPATAPVPVGQRLKRLPTLVDKLARLPTMTLTQLHDIGGCRAVLVDSAEVAAVEARIDKNWTIKRRYDYVAKPKASGYRAIHLVVEKYSRLLEIQLRTIPQHEWAVSVERMSTRLRQDIKFGVGPPELLEFLSMAAEGMALTEAGQAVDTGFMERFQNLRTRVEPYLLPPPPPAE